VALRKTTFYVAYVKMTKFGIKISFFVTHFLSFLHSQKLSVFHETVREHIEYRDIHADIFTKFLNFFFVFQVKGAYAPVFKSAFSF
jgi:hypothetical protein